MFYVLQISGSNPGNYATLLFLVNHVVYRLDPRFVIDQPFHTFINVKHVDKFYVTNAQLITFHKDISLNSSATQFSKFVPFISPEAEATMFQAFGVFVFTT